MRTLTTFQRLGKNCNRPRLWIESTRLNTLGFTPQTRISLEIKGTQLTIKPNLAGTNQVSSRKAGGQIRPIIDINSTKLLQNLTDYEELRIDGNFEIITASPSIRAFHIQRQLKAEPPWDVIELFAGGGTLSQAVTETHGLNLIAGCEIEPDYADIWEASHPQANLIQTDIRRLNPHELQPFNILIAGIPCTSHSTIARAKKSLAGKPELGNTGDLYIPVLNIIASHMPLAIVLENVPSFGESLAGQTIQTHLTKLGYKTTACILEPSKEWNEPSNRRRWVLIATLSHNINIQSPQTPFCGTAGDFLDQENPLQDKQDAERIAKTMIGLRVHEARHLAQGHGFSISTIDRASTQIPVITRSYHKINTGPFVITPFGERMLRKEEIERIQGCKINSPSYRVAVEILGQGVQKGIFKRILHQLTDQLQNKQEETIQEILPQNQFELELQ